jgi:hypothetical protein
VSTYPVTARRWTHGWELHIADESGNEVGVTQSRTLATGDRMVRDYLALDLDLDDEGASALEIDIRPELEGDLGSRAARARSRVREAERIQREAADAQREIARELKKGGLSGADVATVLGVSTQRVSQLVNS